MRHKGHEYNLESKKGSIKKLYNTRIIRGRWEEKMGGEIFLPL